MTTTNFQNFISELNRFCHMAHWITGLALYLFTCFSILSEKLNTLLLFRWKDITNVVNHKRYFVMECQVPDRSVQFQFTDVESAKYVWRMCVYQVGSLNEFMLQYS